VEGKLQTRSWEKDGQKHYRTEVLVNDLSLLSGRDEENKASSAKVHEPQTVADDDIPF
jgi:single-strand DNA-binding protein